jgi:hypothetical protein
MSYVMKSQVEKLDRSCENHKNYQSTGGREVQLQLTRKCKRSSSSEQKELLNFSFESKRDRSECNQMKPTTYEFTSTYSKRLVVVFQSINDCLGIQQQSINWRFQVSQVPPEYFASGRT